MWCEFECAVKMLEQQRQKRSNNIYIWTDVVLKVENCLKWVSILYLILSSLTNNTFLDISTSLKQNADLRSGSEHQQSLMYVMPVLFITETVQSKPIFQQGHIGPPWRCHGNAFWRS